MRDSLFAFRRTFSTALEDRVGAPLDTSDDWWHEKVDALRAQILLVSDSDVRQRLADIVNVLAFIEPVAQVVDNGETFEETGYNLMEESVRLVGAYMRGDRPVRNQS
jgi:hypothetical protein